MSDIDARFRRVVGDDAVLDPDEVESLRRVVALAAELDDEDRRPTAPPASLWAGIAAAVADTGPDPADHAGPVPPTAGGAVPTVSAVPGVADLAAHRARRGRTLPWVLGAAAAVVAVVAGVVGVGLVGGGDDTTVVASADLDVLEDGVAPGSARLVDADGQLVLELDAELGPVDGFHEVWLLTPEVDGLVSLGPLRDDGRYELPAGVDPERYSVVDVSVEPLDGDPTHSGRSVLRGPLSV